MPKHDAAEFANQLHSRLLQAGVIVGPLLCAEIGARKPAAREMSREPFYALSQRRIFAFEADSAEAERLSGVLDTADGIEVVDAAVGDREGTATLYVTRHPKCSSLYRPNDAFLDRYPGLDLARLDRTVEVRLTTLDAARTARSWPRIDFIKMDVQGAELDVIRGATKVLQDTVAIVSEVLFQSMYLDQPLFGDISTALAARGFEFYRFIHSSGRARTDTRDDQVQTLWGDALFVRAPEDLEIHAAARLAVLATLYGALDVAEVAAGRIGGPVADWFVEAIEQPPPSVATVGRRNLRRMYRGIIRRMRAGGERMFASFGALKR